MPQRLCICTRICTRRCRAIGLISNTLIILSKRSRPRSRDENGRKTCQLFSTSTFEYETENENGKAGHKLMEYEEFRKRANSSRIM